jgi:hypothetical protein
MVSILHVDQHPGQHAQGFDLLDVKRASPLFTGTAVDEIEDYPGRRRRAYLRASEVLNILLPIGTKV